MYISGTKKLTTIEIKAPIPNQKTKKPTVAISITKKIPAAINQNCHTKIPPLPYLLLYYKNKKKEIVFIRKIGNNVQNTIWFFISIC